MNANEVKKIAKITEVDFGEEVVNKLFAVLDYIRLGKGKVMGIMRARKN